LCDADITMKRFNLKFLLVLIVLAAALGAGALVAYKIQRKRSVAALLVQAKAAEKAGDRAKAGELYAHYLGFRPDDSATMADYGYLLAGDANSPANRYKALPYFAQVLRRDPSRSDVRREIIEIAMDRSIQQYPQALEQIEALLDASPDDGSLEFQKARCLEEDRKYPEAVEFYEKATTHAPDLIDAYVRQAGLLRTRLAKPAEADKVLDHLVERNPKSFRGYLERGNQRRLSGAQGADQDIARAVELAPDEVDVLAAAADLAIGKGQFDEARRLVTRCLALRPKEARFHDLSSRLEIRAGRADEAEAILRKGLENGPDTEGQARLLVGLADLQIARGNYSEADRTIERMGTEKVRPEIVKYLAARVLAGKGQWREAAKALDDVRAELNTIPDMAYEANLLLARCSEQLGEGDRRSAAYARAVALKPQGLPARLGLAEALSSTGRIEEAISQYRNLEGEVPEVRTALARLLIHRNLQRPTAERDWAEVYRALEAAEASSPGSMDIQLLRAEAFADSGRLDESRKELKAAAGRFPDRDAPWIAQAELALKEGRPEVASSVLDQADRNLRDRIGLRLARAEVWVARGGKEAIGALDRLAEGLDRLPEPDRPRLLRGLAEAHRLLGDLPGARRIMDRLVEQSPEDLSLRLASFDLAFWSGDAAGMKSTIEAIGDKDEVAAQLARARYLGWLASRSDQPSEVVRASLDEARRLLGQAAARRPGWLPVVLAVANVEDQGGNQEGAIRGYLQAIDLGERGTDILVRAIELLASRARYDQADEVVRKVLGDNASTKEPRFYRLAAEVAMRVKDTSRALGYAAKAVPTNSAIPGDRLWRGRLLWAAGKTPQAEADLRAAATTAGEAEAPDAWTSLVAFLATTGRQPQAEGAIEQARQKLPERARPLALARCFAVLGRPDQAREQYRSAIAAAPQDVATLRGASEVALGTGNYEDAKDYLRKLVARQDDSSQETVQARRILGVLLAASGDRRQARESLAMMGLEDGLPYRPTASESIDDLRAKAQVLALRGGRQNRRAALEALTAIINREKPSPDDRFLLAQVLEMNGDWAKSREQMQLLLADFADSPAYLAFYVRGLLRHEDGRGVKPWLEKLQKVDPSSLQTAELKARLALAEKRPDEAAKLLGDFARTKPDSTLQVALVLESLGRLDEAEKLFRGFATQDKQPEAGLPLAVFLGRRKRVPEALDLCDQAWKAGRPELVSQASVAVLYASMPDKKVCQRVAERIEDAIRRAPEKDALRFDLANVQILQGKYQEAEVIFRKIYDKDKENTASANNLAWLLTIQDGKASEALALVDRAIELAGPLPTLLDTRGMARMALDQVAPAIEDLEEATTSGPSATLYFHLAQAYRRLNRTREAKEALKEAKVLGLDEATIHPTERAGYRQLLGDLAGG
jgi:tetratricopeptide (TPR) repeat protein